MVSLKTFKEINKMSNHKDSLVKVLEYLVNEDREKASDLLHDIFVEKAKNHWSALSESDESVEEDIQEEDLDETYDIDEEEVEEAINAFDAEEDFLDDIESSENEIDQEEIYDDENMDDEDAVMDLAVSMDDNGEGEIEGEEGGDAEEALANVEDAIAELRAAFADLMGDEAEEDEGEEEGEEDEAEEGDEEEEISFEAVEEGATLKAVNVTMSGDEDGKSSPVKDAGNEHDVKPHPTDTKVENGGKAPAAKDMGVTGPQEAGKLSAAPKPQTREKK